MKKTMKFVFVFTTIFALLTFPVCAEEGVSGINPSSKGVEGDTSPGLSYMNYKIVGDEIVLESVKGSTEIAYIDSSYTVDGVQYKTSLKGFQVESTNVHAVVFSVGTTHVDDAVFNSCGVTKVYFPVTMEEVNDYCLSYLQSHINVDEGEHIEIYYEGTQDQWQNIFHVFERTAVGDAETAEEKGKALADWINEKIGVEYDSSAFLYYFNSIPEDLVASVNNED